MLFFEHIARQRLGIDRLGLALVNEINAHEAFHAHLFTAPRLTA
jgi:hypothetical protein